MPLFWVGFLMAAVVVGVVLELFGWLGVLLVGIAMVAAMVMCIAAETREEQRSNSA